MREVAYNPKGVTSAGTYKEVGGFYGGVWWIIQGDVVRGGGGVTFEGGGVVCNSGGMVYNSGGMVWWE